MTIAIVIIALVSSMCGYQCCRVLARERRISLALTAGTILGVNFYIALINGLAFWFPLSSVIRISGVTLALVTLALSHKKFAPPPLINDFGPSEAAAIGIALVLAGGYALAIGGNPDLLFDRYLHGPLVASLANGQFPPLWPGVASIPTSYHYGFDLFAASVAVSGGIAAWQGEIVAITFTLATTWLFTYALGKRLGGNRWTGWGAAALLFFGGAWLVPWPLSHLGLFQILPQTIGGYGTQLLHPATAMATPLTILALYLWHKTARAEHPLLPSLLLGFALGQLRLFGEDRVVFLSTALVLLAIGELAWQRFRAPALARVASRYLPAGLVCLALLLSSGGIISGSLSRGNLSNLLWLSSLHLAAPSLPLWENSPALYRAWPIGLPQTATAGVREFGLGLIGLGGVALLLLSRRIPGPAWSLVLTAAALSFLVTPFFQFTLSDFNRPRLFATFRDLSNFAAGVVLGILVVAMARGYRQRRYAHVVVGATAIVGMLLFTSGAIAFTAYQMYDGQNRIARGVTPTWLTPEEQSAAAVGRRLPRGSVILTANPITVGRLWGQQTAYMEPFTWQYFNELTILNAEYAALLQHPTLTGLDQVGITHVYVSPPRQDAIPGEPYRQPMATDLYERDVHFELLFSLDRPNGAYRIYAYHRTSTPFLLQIPP